MLILGFYRVSLRRNVSSGLFIYTFDDPQFNSLLAGNLRFNEKKDQKAILFIIFHQNLANYAQSFVTPAAS